MFAGGAVERMAVFALNVMPYISASIIMTLMKGSIPSLKELDKEGQQGRKQINQYTRYLTVFLAAFQAYAIAVALQGSTAQGPDGSVVSVVLNPGVFFQVSTVITLVGFVLFLFVALTVLIVFVERAQRRLLVQYPKRQMAGGKTFGGESSFMPLKLNTPGVIPPIFASALIMLPTTASTIMIARQTKNGGEASGLLTQMNAWLSYGQPGYLILYGVLIVFFCFFYVPYVFKPEDVADNLRKNGGFLPGVRPGDATAKRLSYVLSRLTFIGAFYVAFVCVVPEIVIAQAAGAIPSSVALLIGGMSLLIIVSVTLDTVSQIQSHLIAHQYEGLIKKSRMRRRKK